MASSNIETIRPGPAMFPFFMPQYSPAALAAGINAHRFRLPLQQPPFHFNPAGIFPALNPSIMPPQPPAIHHAHHPHQHHNHHHHHPQHHHHQQPQPQQPVVAATNMPPNCLPAATSKSSLIPISPVPNLTLTFTQEEVDTVLYGYTKGRSSDRYHGHALSGLKFGDLSHGIDRILSNQTTSPSGSHSDVAGSTCSSSSDSGCSIKKSPGPLGVLSNEGGNNNSNSFTITNSSHTLANIDVFPSQSGFHEQLYITPSTTPAHTTTKSPCPRNNRQQSNNKNDTGGGAGVGSSSISCISNDDDSNNNKTLLGGVVVNKLPLDPVALGLQDGLAILQTVFAGTTHTGVFCTKTVIARGTRYGPFKGRVINTSEVKTLDDNTCMWEIFQEGKLSHFIDGHGGGPGNWMAFINCARYAQEQNLIAIQVDGEIWYETCKDIPQGTELLVWYGDCYLQFMGVPVALKEMADGGAQDEADSSEGFQCDRCGKVFAYKYYRDKHLKYTRCVDQGDRKYPCHLCTRSFEKRDRLRIHILHVHEKHRPHKCLVCAKSFSQSSSLNKHMRVHSGERPYKCVYCNKAFTASSILRTHIRQHSGEKPFKCKHCGKAFASHAAHDSHVRRTHAKDRPCTCSICGKTFQQAFQLKFHMSSHMTQ